MEINSRDYDSWSVWGGSDKIVGVSTDVFGFRIDRPRRTQEG